MREMLGYLHILKTTDIFYIYEAVIVNKILMKFLLSKNTKSYEYK